MPPASRETASFHTATLDEVHQMIDWARQEGWNPGLDDAEAFWRTDQDGFFIARIEGEMVAAISVVNHNEHMAFLGLYLCKPAFRGQGIGLALWNHALPHAGSRCIGLDGVAAQEANYAKSGFVRQGAITRWEGQIPDGTLGNARMLNQERDFEALALRDADAIGYERRQFLDQWLLTQTPTRKTVVLETEGAITGYATARLCQEGIKIGPIIAQNDDDAMELLKAAASSFDEEKITVDLHGRQENLSRSLHAMGFAATFKTAHMFRGIPPREAQSYRAVASMECG